MGRGLALGMLNQRACKVEGQAGKRNDCSWSAHQTHTLCCQTLLVVEGRHYNADAHSHQRAVLLPICIAMHCKEGSTF
eukprot:1157305-Pelagomonas_calceolata.AAC.4